MTTPADTVVLQLQETTRRLNQVLAEKEFWFTEAEKWQSLAQQNGAALQNVQTALDAAQAEVTRLTPTAEVAEGQ